MKLRTALAALGLLATPVSALGDTAVDRNIVYGMYSGLALLLDIHRPARPNGFGVVYIGGSAYHAPLGYDARPLKDVPAWEARIKPMLEGGYTVFVINHRAAPRFHHPAAIEDAQRAVRFVRYHAKQFGLRPDRIGAAGSSSGGYLASLLGALDGKGDPEDGDPVNRQSAKVQCVAALAAPADFINVPTSQAFQASYLGAVLRIGLDPTPPTAPEYKIYRRASPVSHASKDDPPFLLIHGDADNVVLFRHSELMVAALTRAGAIAKLLRIKGGGHRPPFPAGEPDPGVEMARWFDVHLRGQRG